MRPYLVFISLLAVLALSGPVQAANEARFAVFGVQPPPANTSGTVADSGTSGSAGSTPPPPSCNPGDTLATTSWAVQRGATVTVTAKCGSTPGHIRVRYSDPGSSVGIVEEEFLLTDLQNRVLTMAVTMAFVHYSRTYYNVAHLAFNEGFGCNDWSNVAAGCTLKLAEQQLQTTGSPPRIPPMVITNATVLSTSALGPDLSW